MLQLNLISCKIVYTSIYYSMDPCFHFFNIFLGWFLLGFSYETFEGQVISYEMHNNFMQN